MNMIPVLMPVFPRDPDEREICLEGLRPGGWLRRSLERLAEYDGEVLIAADATTARELGVLGYAAIHADPGQSANALLPPGSEALLDMLVRERRFAPEQPVVIHDYRYPLALRYLKDMTRMLAGNHCVMSVADPRDHPIQAMQAFELSGFEALYLQDRAAGDASDLSWVSYAFQIIGLSDSLQGTGFFFKTDGWYSRIVPYDALDSFLQVRTGNAVPVKATGAAFRRLSPSLTTGREDLEIVALPALRSTGKFPALGVRLPENARLLVMVQKELLEKGTSLLGMFFTDRFLDLHMLFSPFSMKPGPLRISFGGHDYVQAGEGIDIPENAVALFLSFMEAVAPGQDIFWFEPLPPAEPLWSTVDGVLCNAAGAPVTCSQHFPEVWVPRSALTGGPTSILSNITPESCKALVLARTEDLCVNNRLAMLQYEIVAKERCA